MENKNMRKLNVTVQCVAVYNSSIMVPRELTFEEAIKYAKEHIDEINLGELEYIRRRELRLRRGGRYRL